jgi:hypothetical protein
VEHLEGKRIKGEIDVRVGALGVGLRLRAGER